VANYRSIQENTVRILSKLAVTSVLVLHDERQVPSSLGRTDYSNPGNPTRLIRNTDLKAICSRLRDYETMGMDLNLDFSISLIQLRIKLKVCLRESDKRTLNSLIKDLVKESREVDGCTDWQLRRWVAWGSRLAEFSGAGGFFCRLNNSPGLMKK
jgi:hypothetical protein